MAGVLSIHPKMAAWHCQLSSIFKWIGNTFTNKEVFDSFAKMTKNLQYVYFGNLPLLNFAFILNFVEKMSKIMSVTMQWYKYVRKVEIANAKTLTHLHSNLSNKTWLKLSFWVILEKRALLSFLIRYCQSV